MADIWCVDMTPLWFWHALGLADAFDNTSPACRVIAAAAVFKLAINQH